MRTYFVSLLAFALTLTSFAQERLDYFMPEDVTYDLEIPPPDRFFGQQMGEWHLTHGQVLAYLNEIARISDRVIIYEYARSYENKPLVQMVFTSPENQGRLEELKVLHTRYSDPAEQIPVQGVPLVVHLGYGVHGNESSGTNSAVLTAYYLAAARGEKIDRLMGNTIIIVDPCLNPDGFTRHSTWANMHQGAMASGDENSRQFYEVWPGGRTNHYWFDLNRDYLLMVHPETRGRVASLQEWKPNIVTDHHESGPDFSFFFMPGIPSRNNPLTPEKNFYFTEEIAKYHARFLDGIGSPYFSEEAFDDYYYGKGSTYPDILGGIGILFEQAGFRGRIRETENGLMKFTQAIRNQFTATLSTLEASMELHDELLEYQREFYSTALEQGGRSETKAYLFGSATDRIKTGKFVELLNRHQIEVYKNLKDGFSYVVPVRQKQYRLIQTIFEEVTTFNDTSFYDVSTWTLTHAFDIPVTRLTSLKDLRLSEDPVADVSLKGSIIGGKSRIGYLLRWNEYSTPEALYQIEREGLMTRVATGDFAYMVEDRKEHFTLGTILIPVLQQARDEDRIFTLISGIAERTGLDFYGLATGLSPEGFDLGSNSFARIEEPRILMFTGGSTNSYTAGEIWHLLDQVFRIPVTCAPTDRMRTIDLDLYNRIILPGGSYREWGDAQVQELRRWVEDGGTLLAFGDAPQWTAEQELGKTTYKMSVPPDTTKYLRYADREQEYRLQLIGGAILRAEMDLTHPLCYGYQDEMISLMKRGTTVAEPLGIKYAEPVRFAGEPYVSGWVSDENLDRIREAPVISVQSLGTGKLISFHENMNFRGIWLGTHKLLSNALFFSGLIR